MKKTKLLMPLTGIAALGAVAPVVALTSCTKDNTNTNAYIVAFVSNGGSSVESVTIKHGDKITKPADPTRVGYTFDGWYTDPDCTKEYNFDTLVSANMILYAGWIAEDLTLSVPQQFTLNYGATKDSSGNNATFYSTKTIRVYDEKGELFNSDNLYFESDRPGVAAVNRYGEIIPAPLGEIQDTYANISVYLKGEQRPFATVRVDVKKQDATDCGISWATTGTLAGNLLYSNFTHDNDGVCLIPDSVNVNDVEYPVYLTTPTNPTLMNGVTQLMLPHNFGGINNNFSFSNGILQDIYFAGTIDEFGQTRARWIDQVWMGKKVTSIQCTDGQYTIANRYDADLAYDETLGHIVMKTTEFSESKNGALFKFDYSKFGLDVLAKLRSTIYINNAVVGANTSVSAVYLNGVALTSGTDYNFITATNVIEFTTVGIEKLNAAASIVVECNFAPKDATKNVYLSCDAGWPTELKITKRAPQSFYVNEQFSIGSLEVTASGNALEYVVPTEYLEFYIQDGAELKKIEPGKYVFKDADVARLKTVYIYDTITGLHTQYTISVWRR